MRLVRVASQSLMTTVPPTPFGESGAWRQEMPCKATRELDEEGAGTKWINSPGLRRRGTRGRARDVIDLAKTGQ